MEQNDHDIVLCKTIVRIFIAMWKADKPVLMKAMQESDFHHIHALVHRLKGSIRYIGNESIECNAVLIKKQAQELQANAIKYTVKLFIRELDFLSKEVTIWLDQQAKA